MNYFLFLLALIISSFLLSIILVRAMITIMPKFGIVDRPDKRRAHTKITPRAGGLAFVITFLLLLPISEYCTLGTLDDSSYIIKIFFPIALISFWDDVADIPILLRLIIHILCSVLAVMWLIHPYKIFHNEFSLVIDFLVGSFALLAFLNIYNFLDGIDGITTSQSIHLSLTLLILCFFKNDVIPNIWQVVSTCSIILGWSVGFILFNWQPAKIFPGDVGSISIGFLLGISLLTVATGSERLFVSCIIAPLYYIADGVITVLIRLSNFEKIWQPHLQHFFQKAVKRGLSHRIIVLRIAICNFLLMIFAIGALFYPVICVILAFITVAITLIKSVT